MATRWRYIVPAAILAFFMIFGAASAEACSTLIVGKDASITGEVLFGHNEDNGGRLIMPMYRVPRMQHAPGTMIDFGDGRAKIPQVPETWSYVWSETRSSGGASFSDGYLNEWGVAVASDSCGTSQHLNSGGTINEGGIGYGLRTIIAQRAKTAREGVLIAAELLETYGYIGSGRAYAIVDKNEAWLFQAVRGEFYAAKRVPDDEVCFIPNKYTIHEVDLSDTENYICHPNLITYAIEQGWYTPAVNGDYSDFSFAKAYQYNWVNYDVRHYNAIKFLTGTDPEGILPFSIKLDRKIGLEDVKALLRYHYEGTPDDLTEGYCCDRTPHYSGLRVICTSSTQESFVIQFREDPNFNVYWRATGNPCRSPYVPWYGGITRVPDGYGWMDHVEGFATHFSAYDDDFSYYPDLYWWAFMDLKNITEPQYGDTIEMVQKEVFKLEKQWAKKQRGIETAARAIYRKHPEKALEFLTNYTNKQAGMAWEQAIKLYNKLAKVEIHILADELVRRGPDTVSVAIMSAKGFDATQVDFSTVRFGLASINPVSRPLALSYAFEDLNGNGRLDAVVTFDNYSVTSGALSNRTVYNDMWLQGKTLYGDNFVARDFVLITP